MRGTRPVRRLLVAALAAGLALAGVAVPDAPAATLPGGAYLFAGLEGQLAAIDRGTGQVVASVGLPAAPADVETGVANGSVFAAIGGSVYVVSLSTVTVTRIITSSNADAEYVSVALSPDGSRLYALDQQNNVVDVYNPRSKVLVSSIPVLTQIPWTLEISPNGSSVYVVYSGAPTATVIDTASAGVVGSVALPSTAEGIAFDASGQVAYILCDPPSTGGTHSTIAVVDTATRSVTTTWASAAGAIGVGLALSPDGSRLYVADQGGAGDGRLDVFDTTTGTVLRTVATGYPALNSPRVSPDGSEVYVGEDGNQVVAFDTTQFAGRVLPTTADVNAISLLDMAKPVFERSNADTYVAGVEHQSAVVAAAFPAAALSVQGTLPAGVAFTDNGDGTGTFSGTATTPGTYLVTLLAQNSVGLTTQPYTVTVVPGPPAVLDATSGGGQTAAPNTLFATQVKATLRDSVGNPVAGGSVTFTVRPAGAASFSGVPSFTATTQADGTVVAPFLLAGPTLGPLNVDATYAGLAPATFLLFISSGPAPGAPTITTVTPADGSAHVAFSPGAAGSGPTTGYRVVATDVTEPSRGGQTVDGTSSPITVTGLANGDTYTFTVTALSAAGNSPPSPASAPVVIGVPSTPPQPPTIDSLTAGDGSVQVVFTVGAVGSTPTTGYRVTAADATDVARGGQTAEGSASPITVTGLTNGDTYTFTVVAISAAGDSGPSVPSPPIKVGIPPQVSGSPPNGRVGVPYAFTFTVSGAPTPTLTLSGILPVGLTFDASTGSISGFPSSTGTYPVEVDAANGVGQQSVIRTLTIGTGLGGPEPTPTTTPTPSPTTTPTTSPTTSPTSGPTTSPTGTSGPSAGGSPSTPPTGSAGAASGSSSPLAHTGTAAGWLLPLAGLLLVGGALAVVSTRRRRTGEGA